MSRYLVLFLFTFLAACSKNRETPADTLVVALGAEPVTLDPRFATDAYGMRIAGLIFNSLIRMGADFKPQPELAEKWKLEGRVYTFDLKQDARFHDGRKVEPADIEFSFGEFMKPGRPFASMLEPIKKVHASLADDGHIRVRVEVGEVSDVFLAGTLRIVKVLPRDLAEKPDFSGRPIGTGPFRFEKQDASSVRLAAVSGKMPFIEFKVIRDDLTRFQKTLNGEIDINQSEISLDKVAEFEKRTDKFTVAQQPSLNMAYLVLNLKDPVLKQKPVREALALSLERGEIIKYKLHGLAREATSVLTPENPYFNRELKNPAFDPAAAKKIIDGLGLAGKEVSLKTSNAQSAVDNGKVLANQLARTGLKVNLQSFEWATYYDDIKKGRFQIATMRWVGIIDPDFYRQVFHSSELPPGRNRGGYSNPDLDVLLMQGSKETRPDRRLKIYAQVQKIVQDDFAMIPLWYDQQVAISKKNVLNYRPEPAGDYWPLIAVQKTQ